MDDNFDLPVQHDGKELEFKTRLARSGYVNRFHIMMNDAEIVFELDDEHNFRAVNYNEEVPDTDKDMILSIITSLQAITG